MKNRAKAVWAIIALFIVTIIAFNWSNIKSAIRVLRMDNSTEVSGDAVREYLKWKGGVETDTGDRNMLAIYKWNDCIVFLVIDTANNLVHLTIGIALPNKDYKGVLINSRFPEAIANTEREFPAVDIRISEEHEVYTFVEFWTAFRAKGMGDFKVNFDDSIQLLHDAYTYHLASLGDNRIK